MPCPTPYGGGIGDIADHLSAARPVGWTDELSKLQDMGAAVYKVSMVGQDSWPVKFRNISPGVVLPRQVRTYAGHGRQLGLCFIFQSLLFMDQDTLSGARKDVYVLAKIIKYATGSKAKSYQLKWAVDDIFLNKEPSEDNLGGALREVMEHPVVRGTFGGVHDDLKKLGVTKVVVRDNEIDFESE